MELVRIPDLSHQEQNQLDELLAQWRMKLSRNWLRSVYYDTKNELKDLRISLPPQLARAESMLGWPAKAVHALAARSNFDGFVLPGSEQDPFGIAGVLEDNDFDVELPQAVTSCLVHSVSFLTTTAGDVASGEPEVLVLARSARHGTALVDRRRRVLRSALAITDVNEAGEPSELVMYLPDSVVTVSKSVAGVWRVDRRPNVTGRVLVTPLIYRPELDRPFGHSRISRAVMQLTDAAVRTFVRAEVGGEFYASPQRWALGADEDAFGGDEKRWRAVMSRMLAISRDEDGNLPELGQFPQMTMQPHSDQLRMIAGLFSGETGLPLSSLGIVHDNPASAEAIFAEKEDLVIETGAANRVWGSALRNVAVNAVMVRDGLESVPDELRGLQAKWRNPATPSVVSASQAAAQKVATVPWLAETDVILEDMGYDQATVTRLLESKKRVDSRNVSGNLGLAATRLAAQQTTQGRESRVVGDVVGDQSAG